MNHQLEREKQLQDWEAMLKAKEMELNGRHRALQALYYAEASLGRIHEVGLLKCPCRSSSNFMQIIVKGKTSISKAHNALIRSLEQVSSPATIKGPDACAVALNAIEEAVAYVTSFQAELEHLQEQTEESSARSLILSEVIQPS